MTRNDIITLPSSLLRTESKRIGVVSGQVKQLVDDMTSATLDWEDHRQHEIGVALAAIQIGRQDRVVIIRNDFDNKEDRSFQVLINPKISKLQGEVIEDFEGCLSIRDLYGKVPRYSKVKVDALDDKGQKVRVVAEGFLARVLQHEIDHTNGKLFIDHIKKNREAFFHLKEDGKLEPIDYEKQVAKSNILW